MTKKLLSLSILALVLLTAACGDDDSDSAAPETTSTTSVFDNFDEMSSSNIRVTVYNHYETGPPFGTALCGIDPIDYPIDVGDRPNWHMRIFITRNVDCGNTDFTLQPEQVDGSDAALINTSDVDYGADNYSNVDEYMDAILAPGVYRLAINGRATNVTITVTSSTEATASTILAP